ncbi:MAG: HAD family hydrolase [Candidatus Obscuribacterales bacterium]|nr:HAD family hydrolase [Candidatus Obscuribacterales bacterium]
MKRLVLFDIDETMIYSDGVGRRAMETALKQVFDERLDAGRHNMSGKTDPQICFELLSELGYSLDEIKSRLPLAFKVYLERLELEIENAGKYGLHQGVLELLRELEKRPEIHLGLLTGNIEEGARLKLEPFDLNSYFVFGAFGSDSADRMDLPLFAHKRAEEVFGKEFLREEIVIIGDAVNDVLCAQGYGVKSIITATGKTPRETLAGLKPDYLFDSLLNTAELIEAILA